MSIWEPQTPRSARPCGNHESLGSCLFKAEAEESGFEFGRASDELEESIPRTPRLASPCDSPRFVRTPQPQKLFPGSCMTWEEGEVVLVRASDDLHDHPKLHKTIQEFLLRWLNEEVSDRLDRIDRRLQEIHETSKPELNSGGKGRCSTRISEKCGLGLTVISEPMPSQAQRLSDVVEHGADAKKRPSKGFIRETTVSEVIQTARGRHAASVWCFLEYRFSSWAAYVWSFVVPCLIFVSIFFSFWQSVDDYPFPCIVGDVLHALIELVFAIELSARFLVCPDRRMFRWDPLNAIDLLTCLPLSLRLFAAIVNITGGNLEVKNVLSALCMFPTLKLLKLSRRFEKFQLLFSAFLIALEALPVLLYTMFTIALAFSGMVYAVEPRENISNLPHAMWFVLVTMTTCGYGDVSPSTLPGKLITSVLMVVSILYMAIPIGIVGHAFSQAWDARDRLLLMHRIREAFLQQGFNETAFRYMVRLFAGDSGDELGLEEFHSLLQQMDIDISDDRVYMLLNHLDQDGNGRIDIDELLRGLFPRDYAEYFNGLRSAAITPSPSLPSIS